MLKQFLLRGFLIISFVQAQINQLIQLKNNYFSTMGV